MAGLSDFAENKIQDAIWRAQALGAPATLYIALLTCTKGVVARSTAYALNDTAVVSATDGKLHLYKVTTAGTTAGSAPTYAGAAGEAITDGAAVLTEQDAALDANTNMGEPTIGTGAYARVPVTASLANFAGTQSAASTTASTGTGGQTSNNGAITFPTSTTAWAWAPALAWGVAVYDAASGGNLWWWGPMTNAQNVGVNNTVSFAAGQLTATIG